MKIAIGFVCFCLLCGNPASGATLENGPEGFFMPSGNFGWNVWSVCFDQRLCPKQPVRLAREAGIWRVRHGNPTLCVTGRPFHFSKSKSAAEYGCIEPDGVKLLWETGRFSTPGMSRIDARSWESEDYWLPQRFSTGKIYESTATQKHYLCSDNLPEEGEAWTVKGKTRFFVYDLEGPGRRRAFAQLKKLGMVASGSTIGTVLPLAWGEELRRLAQRPEGKLFLLVRQDLSNPSAQEGYWYVGLDLDTPKPYAGGLVRWNIGSDILGIGFEVTASTANREDLPEPGGICQ